MALTAMLEKLARPILRKTALAMFDALAKEYGIPSTPTNEGHLYIARSDFPRFLTALRDQARARLKGLL